MKVLKMILDYFYFICKLKDFGKQLFFKNNFSTKQGWIIK